MTRPELGDTLAALNAALNGTCAVLLVLGRIAIARRARETHRRSMVSAFVVSCVFLTSYLTRMALTGAHHDPHRGWLHVAYLVILTTHVTLAATVPPLAIVALRFAALARWSRHRAVVKWALPIWLYVSVTGVVVYAVLYRVPV